MKWFEELVQQKISEALSGAFTDATTYGQGYIKVIMEDNDISIKHIAWDNIEHEYKDLLDLKKNIS